jgi:hypothetical protein
MAGGMSVLSLDLGWVRPRSRLWRRIIFTIVTPAGTGYEAMK